MEFARRGPATAGAQDDDLDEGRRFPDPPPPHGDAMLVIRDALLLQLQKDRLRQEIIVAELAKIERAMVLRSASCHGIAASDVERVNLASFPFGENFMPYHRWPVNLEHYADVDGLHDLKKGGGRQWGVELRSVNPAVESRVGECSRPCCSNGKVGEEIAAFDEQKLQEFNNPKEMSPSVEWELTGITMPVKKPKPPQKRSCSICQVETPSERHLQEHYAGKKHRSNVATLESRNKAISQEAETTTEPSTCADQETCLIKWSCSTCQANGTSEADLKEHLNGSAHQQNIEAQNREGGGLAKNVELQETKSHESIVPQHAENPPPIWNCSSCQANCTSESDLGSHLLAKIQALLNELNNMARNSELQKATLPPDIAPQHAEQASISNRSIFQADSDYRSDLENHIGGNIQQLNVQALHEEAKQMEMFSPQIAVNQQPHSEWHCSICQAKCYSESQFDNHCRGRKHQKNIQPLLGEGESAKSSGPIMENKVPSDGSDSMSATLEKLEEQVTLYFCEVCNLLCNSDSMLTDHCKGEKHLKRQRLLNFCEVCNLQCNSEKMLAHHRTGKKHLKNLNADK